MSKPTLGIIGGGQLGSMLAIAASKLKLKQYFFVMTLMHLHKISLMNLFMDSITIRLK